MKIGVVILMGGKATRFNHSDKANLQLGRQTFLEKLCETFKDVAYRYISTNANRLVQVENWTTIIDEYDAIGPLGGIVSTFHQSDVDALFVVGVDMPLISLEVMKQATILLEDHQGVFFYDDDHTYMTAGLYTRKLLPFYEQRIQEGNYRLFWGIEQTDVCLKHISEVGLDAILFQNVNTLDDYWHLIA